MLVIPVLNSPDPPALIPVSAEPSPSKEVAVIIPDVLIEIVVDNPLAVPVTSPVRLPSKLVAATTISSLGTGSS